MSYEVYLVLHIIGVVLVFSALAGLVLHVMNGGDRDTNRARGLLAATHGIGLLVVLVAGFGMHAKTGVEGFPGWFIGKLLIWLLLGGLYAVPLRMPNLARPIWFALPLLAGVAVYLASFKPF